MKTARAPSAFRKVTRGLPLSEPRSWLPVMLVLQVALVANGVRIFGRDFPPDIAAFYQMLIIMALLSALLYERAGAPKVAAANRQFLQELLRGSLGEYAFKAALGFVLTLVVFWVLFLELLKARPTSIPFSSVWPMIALQMIFVAPAEELFFRGYLPRLFDPTKSSLRIYAGVSVASLLEGSIFAAFHYAAYGTTTLTPYIMVFVLALVWTFLSRIQVGRPFHLHGVQPLGVPFTSGSHGCWNLCALGIMTGGIVPGV